MNPTTQDEGASAQPNDAAGTQPGDMVISQDVGGTPIMVPADSVNETAQEPSEPAPEEPAAEAQAEPTDTNQEIVDWATKKGITIDPTNENEVKLARVNLENDRRFHESAQKKVPVPDLLPQSDDESYNALIEKQNTTDLKMYVRDWFDANPDMKEHREELVRIAAERPYLQDMEDVAAHLYRDPKFVEKLQSEGGKRALQNLAQKQSNIPPASAATNSGDFASAKITPQNVDSLVGQHDHVWYKEHLSEINAALAG